MKKHATKIALVVTILVIIVLSMAIRNASPQTSQTFPSSGITAGIIYVKTDILIQTDGSGFYQAVNATNGQVISSSTNASNIINSEIKDNTCIALGIGPFVLTNT